MKNTFLRLSNTLRVSTSSILDTGRNKTICASSSLVPIAGTGYPVHQHIQSVLEIKQKKIDARGKLKSSIDTIYNNLSKQHQAKFTTDWTPEKLEKDMAANACLSLGRVDNGVDQFFHSIAFEVRRWFTGCTADRVKKDSEIIKELEELNKTVQELKELGEEVTKETLFKEFRSIEEVTQSS